MTPAGRPPGPPPGGGGAWGAVQWGRQASRLGGHLGCRLGGRHGGRLGGRDRPAGISGWPAGGKKPVPGRPAGRPGTWPSWCFGRRGLHFGDDFGGQFEDNFGTMDACGQRIPGSLGCQPACLVGLPPYFHVWPASLAGSFASPRPGAAGTSSWTGRPGDGPAAGRPPDPPPGGPGQVRGFPGGRPPGGKDPVPGRRGGATGDHGGQWVTGTLTMSLASRPPFLGDNLGTMDPGGRKSHGFPGLPARSVCLSGLYGLAGQPCRQLCPPAAGRGGNFLPGRETRRWPRGRRAAGSVAWEAGTGPPGFREAGRQGKKPVPGRPARRLGDHGGQGR
jgi:hypothetical protein